MKRVLILTGLAGWLALSGDAGAQNPVGDAVRQELEDRLRRVERDLEAVKEANDALRRKLSGIESSVGEVGRAAVERANSNNNILKLTATKDELLQLEKALKESEQHREADKKWFVEQLKELGRVIASPPSSPSTSTPAHSPTKSGRSKGDSGGEKPRTLPPGTPDTGVYHLVEKNQTALEILKAYNDDLKAKGRTTKITLKQLEAANPGTNMDRLRSGQKLFIPIPEK
ncbi:MAG: LysM domain-containing protein [Limisphaerales bacterium]